MTEEKKRKGEELLKRLSHLRDQKHRWERGERFFLLEVCTIGDHDVAETHMSIDGSFVNFDEIKFLAIAKINRAINEAQEEFNRL